MNDDVLEHFLPHAKALLSGGDGGNGSGDTVGGNNAVDTSTPLAYQLGKQVFMGLEFLVDPRVLIPRQSSSTLVHVVASRAASGCAAQDPSVLDMGTGSGCLVVAALKALAKAQRMPTTAPPRGVAIDLDTDALAIAAQNVERLGCGGMIKLVKGSFSDPPRPVLDGAPYAFVLCNPPYRERRSAHQDMDQNVRACEPAAAMYVPDGEDRLVHYREVCASCTRHDLVRAGGGVLVFEAPPDLAERVAVLLSTTEGFRDVQVSLDSRGMKRCVVGVRE